MRSPLLDHRTVPDLVRAVTAATATGAARVASARQPHVPEEHGVLDAAVATVDLDHPVGDLDAALDEVDRLWLAHAVWFHHPRTMAHLNCPVALPAVAAESLAATVNTSMDTWDQSKAATCMERSLLSWTASRLGLPSGADGMFTPGGTLSNLQALMLARDEALDRAAQKPGAPDRHERTASLRILTSAESHFSVVTAARILGLGDDAVVPVPVDDSGALDVTALACLGQELTDRGLTVVAVVATAGTTDRGVIDPLPEISRWCRRHGTWLHVDAAYGGGLICSRRHRGRLEGVEHADSVTVDFHKSWFQPVSCSAVLVRDARTLRHCAHHAAYLNPADTPEPNQVDRSLQTTRRFDALKLWLTLRTVGPDGIGEMIDRVVDLTDRCAAMLREDPRFELVCEPAVTTLLFRWRPPGGEHADHLVRAIRRSVWEAGHATVAETIVAGRPCLKITLLNPATTVDDVREVLETCHEHALCLPILAGTQGASV